MSGFPNMQDIALLRDALDAINRERDAIQLAKNNKQHAELCIDQASQRLRKAMDEMNKLMAAMDCQQTGNTGYENRLIALLTGLAQHSEEYGRKHP